MERLRRLNMRKGAGGWGEAEEEGSEGVLAY